MHTRPGLAAAALDARYSRPFASAATATTGARAPAARAAAMPAEAERSRLSYLWQTPSGPGERTAAGLGQPFADWSAPAAPSPSPTPAATPPIFHLWKNAPPPAASRGKDVSEPMVRFGVQQPRFAPAAAAHSAQVGTLQHGDACCTAATAWVLVRRAAAAAAAAGAVAPAARRRLVVCQLVGTTRLARPTCRPLRSTRSRRRLPVRASASRAARWASHVRSFGPGGSFGTMAA